MSSLKPIAPADCVFCRITSGRTLPDDHVPMIVEDYGTSVVFVPLDPVTDGHVIVVPREHITDAAEAPKVTGQMAELAATYAAIEFGNNFNLIISAGPAATQTIGHLHWHVVPRREGDGLHLPWTGQVCSSTSEVAR